MIVAEFITELRRVHHLFNWKYVTTPGWPRERRSRERLRIRASLCGTPHAELSDPIGAVCFAKTGRVYDAESWIQAAVAIELTLIDAADITAAVNERTWKASGDGRALDPYLVLLRESLVNTVGLQQKPTLTSSL